MEIVDSMPQNSATKRCYAKGLLCKGLKLQVKEPQSEEDIDQNKRSMECYIAALDQDNGLNMARKLIADMEFKE